MANDILLEDNGDLKVANGDFVVGFSDNQHIDLIVRSNPGEIKDYPLLGVGLVNHLNGAFSQKNKQRITRDVRLQLKSDNAKNIKISFTDTLQINANYED